MNHFCISLAATPKASFEHVKKQGAFMQQAIFVLLATKLKRRSVKSSRVGFHHGIGSLMAMLQITEAL